MKRILLAVIFATVLSWAAPAAAENLNVFAGSNIGPGEAGLVTVELAWPFLAEVGPFAQWSRNTKTVERSIRRNTPK